MIEVPDLKPSLLERFGLYYLNLFNRIDSRHSVFDITDEELASKVNHITRKGVILSSLIGLACVFPTVWVDVYFTASPVFVHYSWVALVTLVSVIIEFYILFIIALRAVHEVSEIINMHATENELISSGIFSVQHILARTALELPDPELKILGIDPFERLSKKNLFVLGLLYKAKIIVTNVILKYGLKLTVGNSLFGIAVLYEALPVECFWNSVVIRRVVHEARLRLFGHALAARIGQELADERILEKLSPLARTGCLRAIGNAVVMGRNYHPNMVILLLHFQQILRVNEENKYDDWDLFLDTLSRVCKPERYFLLDLFTVAVAFDARISHREDENLKAAYKEDYAVYSPRLTQLTACLRDGRLNQALSLCKLDLTKG